jgi:hypothetical protein
VQENVPLYGDVLLVYGDMLPNMEMRFPNMDMRFLNMDICFPYMGIFYDVEESGRELDYCTVTGVNSLLAELLMFVIPFSSRLEELKRFGQYLQQSVEPTTTAHTNILIYLFIKY